MVKNCICSDSSKVQSLVEEEEVEAGLSQMELLRRERHRAFLRSQVPLFLVQKIQILKICEGELKKIK